MVDLMKLKNGSDIRGTAVSKDGSSYELQDEVVEKIIKAFYYWLKEKTGKSNLKVSIGYDSRISAKRIEEASIKALVSSGAEVIRCHLSTTPSMFMTTKLISCDAGIEITASHLPYDRNGLKFFTKEGGLEGDDITKVLNYAKESKSIEGKGSTVEVDFMKIYSESLRNFIKEKTGKEKPLEGFKIVVDAGGGAGGFYAYDVLSPLGADVSDSQFLEPDGYFKNHIPNPEDKEAMKSIQKKVIEAKADLGIIFDTDVDRVGAVDDLGNEINRNKLIALISKILLDEKKGYIVTDSITSDGLKKFIEANGGVHYRYKRGYKNVINKAIELNEKGLYTPLAIETSGHAALMENYFLDDGAYLITRLLIQMALLKEKGLKLRDLIKDLKTPEESCEFRISFKDPSNFKEYGLSVIDDLIEYSKNNDFILEKPNYEGVRAHLKEEEGWFLLRMSLHDPIMPLNVESDIKGGVKGIVEKLYIFLKKYKKLNLEKIEEYIK